MKIWRPLSWVLPLTLTLPACMTAAEHRAAVQDESAERLTVGTVQREIRVGMPASEVARVLGSPNIVTTDEKRREVWIYDKIATERVFSTSEGGVKALVFAIAVLNPVIPGGAAVPYYGSSAGATSTSQRTLTVIIKFDEDHKVRDFAYHALRF